jgi:MFS family permease
MTNTEKELSEIKAIMERSTRFISLSGMSGVLAGIYALIGSALAYYWVYYPNSPFGYRTIYINNSALMIKLFITALSVLALSLMSGFVLTKRKTIKSNQSLWNHTSRRFLFSLLLPLITGGVFILALISRGYFVIVAPASLIFYGLALLNASQHTLSDIKYLSYCQILVGLLSAFLPGYGLIFWAFGFGFLHIFYGISMHLKYDR